MKKIDLPESEVVKLYNEGHSLRYIANKFNVSRAPVERILKNANVSFRKSGGKPIYNINQDFFSVIDNEDKAYVLGFLYADGYVVNTKRKHEIKLFLTEKDKEILERIKQVLCFDKPIYYKPPSKSSYSTKGQYGLHIVNKKMVHDLLSVGWENRDSFPNIPQDLQHHFIRGLFDGDGCISFSNKNNRFDCEFYIMGTPQILEDIKEILEKEDIVMSDAKHVKGGIYKIRISGRNNIKKVYSYLYRDATIYLKRKYNKFLAVLPQNTTEEVGLLERN